MLHVFLNCSPFIYLPIYLLTQAFHGTWSFPTQASNTSPTLGLQMFNAGPVFYMNVGDLMSGPSACVVNTFMMTPKLLRLF